MSPSRQHMESRVCQVTADRERGLQGEQGEEVSANRECVRGELASVCGMVDLTWRCMRDFVPST
jgi:hypothetical protein